MAERIRAGGAGIPAFYTPTGVRTLVHKGGAPIKYDSNKQVVVRSQAKESRQFAGREFVLEEAIRGDFAFVKAWKADRNGNLIFRRAGYNFNIPMVKAANVSVVEVEEIVEVGEIDPEHVHIPAIYVHRVVLGPSYEKRIEKVKLRSDSESSQNGSISAEEMLRIKIAKRAAKEFQDGMFANLGIGIPVLSSNYIKPGVKVTLHSENGLLGLNIFFVFFCVKTKTNFNKKFDYFCVGF